MRHAAWPTGTVDYAQWGLYRFLGDECSVGSEDRLPALAADKEFHLIGIAVLFLPLDLPAGGWVPGVEIVHHRRGHIRRIDAGAGRNHVVVFGAGGAHRYGGKCQEK